MGYPSIMILLHELIKLMQYAKVRDPIFFRLGTSGGVDVPAGTIVIATKALNDYLEPYFEMVTTQTTLFEYTYRYHYYKSL